MNNSFTIITAILGSGILSTIISHLLYNQKLKKEQLMKNENGIGKKMREALEEAHELAVKMNAIEIFDIEEELKKDSFRTIGGNAYYLEIMTNRNNLIKMQDDISNYRKNYGRYIDCTTALYVLLLEKYLTQLGISLAPYNDRYWPLWGTLFIVDIQKITRKFEKRLVRRINKQKYKMEFQRGLKWNLLRHFILVRNWNKTLLVRIIDKKKLLQAEAEFLEYILSEINKDM